MAEVSPDQLHRCTVQESADRIPYLAFEPSSGQPSSYSNSLFTLDLAQGTSLYDAQALADHFNRLLRGVSATVF